MIAAGQPDLSPAQACFVTVHSSMSGAAADQRIPYFATTACLNLIKQPAVATLPTTHKELPLVFP